MMVDDDSFLSTYYQFVVVVGLVLFMSVDLSVRHTVLIWGLMLNFSPITSL